MDRETWKTMQQADAAIARLDRALEVLNGHLPMVKDPVVEVGLGPDFLKDWINESIRGSAQRVIGDIDRQVMSHAERGRLGAAARWGKAKRKK
jgi:hypothetical protein